MPEVDPVILQIRADNQRYMAELRNTHRVAERSLGAQERSVKSLENQFRASSGAIGSSLRGLAGTLAAAFSVREIGRLIDGYTRFQNSLRVTGLEGEKLANVQERLRTIGSRYGVELEALGSVFNRAALAQKELGASTEEIIRLNEIVAASLKVTGASSDQARGALLQLSQSLGQDIVRAEEFNSVLEGALPIAQAAARGIDGMEGSVANLRTAIINGEVSSKQFFEGVLKGGTQTIKDAERATLTLGGSFTALRNELTVYVGEAAQTSGATAALSKGILALADNIDILAEALAVIVLWMGTRYVIAAGAAATASIASSRAVFALTAALTGAATASEALTFAMAGLKGGLITAAIIALGTGLYFAVDAMKEASRELDKFTDSADAAEAKARAMEQRLRDAGVAIGDAGDDARGAASEMGLFAKAMFNAAEQARQLREELRLAELVKISARESELRRERKLQKAQRFGVDPLTGQAFKLPGPGTASDDAGKLAAINRELQALEDQRRAIIASVEAGVDVLGEQSPPLKPPDASGGDTKAAKAGGSRSATDVDRRFNDELVSIAQRAISAQASVASTAEERAELELRSLELSRIRMVADIQADKDYSKAQKDRLLAAVETAAQIEREAIAFEEQRQAEEDVQRIAEERFRGEQDRLNLLYDLADTDTEKKRLALRIVDAQTAYLDSMLQRVIDSDTVGKAEQEQARIAQEAVRASAGLRRDAAAKANETAGERFVRSLDPAKINDAIDGIKVDGLRSLNDEIVDAIMGAKSLGDAFKNVADQIIADLLRIAVQQAITLPLANALFGGVGGGLLGGILGRRASGGPVSASQPYIVGERGQELFVPRTSGYIVPNDRLKSGGAPVQVVIQVQANDYFDAKVASVSQKVAGPIAVNTAQQMGQAVTQALTKSMPSRLAQYQRDGT